MFLPLPLPLNLPLKVVVVTLPIAGVEWTPLHVRHELSPVKKVCYFHYRNCTVS